MQSTNDLKSIPRLEAGVSLRRANNPHGQFNGGYGKLVLYAPWSINSLPLISHDRDSDSQACDLSLSLMVMQLPAYGVVTRLNEM